MNDWILAHLRHLRAAGRSADTVRDRRGVLYRADTQLPHGLVAAATAELEAWLSRPDWSRWTLCTYHTHLRGFFRWATGGSDPYLGWNPMADIPRPRPPRCLPDPVDDAELALALDRSDRWWQLVIVLAAYAGLRAGEICRLAREDVTEVRLTVLGKGEKARAVPTHPLVWAVVAQLPPGPLIAMSAGGPAKSRWLSNRARIHFDRLGLPNVHLHRFRHWFGTTVQRLQGDLRVTQELLGHASPATTAGYAAVADAQLRAAVTALPPLYRPS